MLLLPRKRRCQHYPPGWEAILFLRIAQSDACRRTSKPDIRDTLQVRQREKLFRLFSRTEQYVETNAVFESPFSTRKRADNLTGVFQQVKQLAKFPIKGIETIGSMDETEGFSPGNILLEAVFLVFGEGMKNFF